MKFICFLIVLLFSLSSFSQDKKSDGLIGIVPENKKLKDAIKKAKGYKTKLNLGLGVGQQTDLYKSGNSSFPVIPIVGFKYKNFYGFGITLGYTFAWGWPTLSLAIKPELINFKSESNTPFQAINDRDTTLNAGLKAIFPTKYFIGTLDIFHDALGKYDSYKINLEINKPFKISKKFQLIAGIGFDWVTSEYTDYYFGVSQQEANQSALLPINSTNSINSFEGKSAMKTRLQLIAIYDLSKKYSIVFIEEYTSLPSEINDSPLVAKDYLNRFYVSLTYSF